MQWRFGGGDPALHTKAGRQQPDRIVAGGWPGVVLHGPYLTVPAGRLLVRVVLAPGARGTATLEVQHGHGRPLTRAVHRLRGRRVLEELVELPREVEALEVRLVARAGARFAVEAVELDLHRRHEWQAPAPDRPVGLESGKTYAAKVLDGFLDRYLSGADVMEVGYKGYNHQTVPIVPQAIGVDVGYPGYDGRRFPFADESFDAIYSSHCYEHIPDWRSVLRDWYRILRVGGHLVIVVPHRDLFERKRQMPSRWNPDHQRFYTPRSLIAEIESAFDENSYRIRHLVENDLGFDYAPRPREGTGGCFEIELVVEKIRQPDWILDDGAVRPYPPADFRYPGDAVPGSPYEARVPLDTAGHKVWGPYSRLARGRYEAEFFFDLDAVPERPIELLVEVARDANKLVMEKVELAGATRHRFTLPFEATGDDHFWEFRIANRRPQPGAEVIFRGVELRYAARG